ncbi:MAG: DUF2155 domain-containing protein [Alphaproteobacteria bacterium]|nr:DUF2155 domain-containing protein [Alphaproteobacteria bacterium]
MKKLLLIFSIFIFSAANANEYINRETAVVRIMNKAAGRAQMVNIPVGIDTEFDKLKILVRDCKQSEPYAALDYFAFVQIWKSPQNARIFSGWMTASEPGENPMQDADFDLWLLRCE